jgi:hypothetical protein
VEVFYGLTSIPRRRPLTCSSTRMELFPSFLRTLSPIWILLPELRLTVRTSSRAWVSRLTS